MAIEGFDVAIPYFKNKGKATDLKKKIESLGLKAVIISGDITVSKDIIEIKEKSERGIGNISVIVNCSTVSIPNIKFMNLKWEEMQKHYDINIKGCFNLLSIFRSDWEKHHFGKFIALTTLYTEQPRSDLLHYITGKTALNGFIKALAYELSPKGIRLNLVSPGMVDTTLIADIPEKVKLLSAAQTPLRALASAEDIAYAISFLASDKSNYLAGETIRVNGGQFML